MAELHADNVYEDVTYGLYKKPIKQKEAEQKPG